MERDTGGNIIQKLRLNCDCGLTGGCKKCIPRIYPDIIAPSKETIKSFFCQALVKIAEEAKKEERKKMLTELEEMKLDADIFYSKENRFELINRIIKKLNR